MRSDVSSALRLSAFDCLISRESVISHYSPGSGAHYIAQAGLRLTAVSLPQLPESWNYRYHCVRLLSQLYRMKS